MFTVGKWKVFTVDKWKVFTLSKWIVFSVGKWKVQTQSVTIVSRLGLYTLYVYIRVGNG